MPFSCEFNSDFDNSFAICAPVVVVEEPAAGGSAGVSDLRFDRRRRRAIELEGRCSFAVMGIGKVSVQRALELDFPIEIEGGGTISIAHDITASAPVKVAVQGRANVEVSLDAVLEIASSAYGDVQVELGLIGKASLPFAALGEASVERNLRGSVPIYAIMEGDVEVDDEETALALLGLPSEVLL